MIDVDKLKAVNDNYGHMAGDKVLMQLANIFKLAAGTDYTVARWGGEEFIMLLPHTGIESAARLAEEIRHSVETNVFRYENYHLKLTVSIGVVSTSEGINADSFVKSADEMLYKAKEKRNAVASQC